MNEIMIKIDNVSKQYKLGQIGGTTIKEELQRKHARRRGKEDPTKMIGAKDYEPGETFMALDGVSFEVQKGERVGIIGHNGAGKSTLLKLISRVTAPTEGMIGLNGRITSMLEVGTGFHGELTGRENIYMNGAILGMTRKEIDAKIEDIIDFSEVRQFIDTPVKRYSSGMYVKLAFSVAAHLDSEIMIMDEVLAVGDMAFQKKCLDKMNDVSKTQGRTILYVSHNMNTIRQLCERVIVLDHGKVVFDGDVEEGIGIYSGVGNDDLSIYYDLRNSVRPNRNTGEKIFITDFCFLNKDFPVFERIEKMQFRIDFESYSEIEGLNILLAFRRKGKETLGLSQTLKNFCDAKKIEHYSHSFAMDISNLTPGRYCMDLQIYSLDENRNAVVYDYPGIEIVFEVVDSNEEGIRWSDRWFGAVRLNEIVQIDGGDSAK